MNSSIGGDGDHSAPHEPANSASPLEQQAGVGVEAAPATGIRRMYERMYRAEEHMIFLAIVLDRRAWTVSNTDDGCWPEIAQELETKGYFRDAATLHEHFHKMVAVTKALMKSIDPGLGGDLGQQLMAAFDLSGRSSRCWWDAGVFSLMARIRNEISQRATGDFSQDLEPPLSPPPAPIASPAVLLPATIYPVNVVAPLNAVIPEQVAVSALDLNHPRTMVVDMANFYHADIPFELSTLAQGNVALTLLCRDVTTKMLSRLSNRLSRTPMYLTGPGGVGKSSCLFMAAAEVLRCNASEPRQFPVFLLYIANSGELVHYSAEEVAGRLLMLVKALNRPLIEQWKELADLLNQNTDDDINHWRRLVQLLNKSVDIRCFILVDQWNAILEAKADGTLLPGNPLLRFSALNATIGLSLFVGAVSSSFSPVDAARNVFRDGEVTGCQEGVKSLTPQEILALGNIWANRQPPLIVDDQTLLALHEETGGIPRLCEYFASIRVISPNATPANFEWRNQCNKYYLTRIRSLADHLRALENGAAIQSSFRADLAALFLRNRDQPAVASLSANRWQSCGLLVPDVEGTHLIPVNSFVRTAVDMYIIQETAQILRTFYHDSSVRWRALELFITLQLRKGATCCTGTNLRGDELQGISIDHQHLHVVNIGREFAVDPVAFIRQHHGMDAFPPGTVLVPTSWATHPVSDMVLFVKLTESSDPQVVFVQISQSSYAEHESKIPALHRDQDDLHQGWTNSVLKTYLIAFGLHNTTSITTDLDGVKHGKLPQRVKYVYATTNELLLKKTTQRSGHSVFLMRTANIKALNPEVWSQMTG